MADEFKYHAFISYSHVDASWTQEWLLPQLEGAGLQVCIDFRDFDAGAPSVTEIERAVIESCKTLLVLSPAYISSVWGEFENILAQTLDPAARRRRLLPLCLQTVELPPRLGMLTYLDFRDDARRTFQTGRLIAAIQKDCAALGA